MNFSKIHIPQNSYESFNEDALVVDFTCDNCMSNIKLDLMSNYHLLENLVDSGTMSEDEIIKNGLAKLSSKSYKHLGLFAIHSNLPAYYKIIDCMECGYKFIAVFGFGEIQNGRNILYISGIWRIF